LFQFAGWVSAAAVPKLINGQFYLPSDLDDTRNAYLFFSTIGFVLAIIFYFAILFNIIYKFESIPWLNFVSDFQTSHIKIYLIYKLFT
jgi:hypothetical protein